MFSTSPSDPDCQKWVILIKDAAFSSLVSRDRWHHVISELWGFLRWTSVVVVFSCYGILLFWCCLWLQVNHVTRLLVSDSLITWSIDPPDVIRSFVLSETETNWMSRCVDDIRRLKVLIGGWWSGDRRVTWLLLLMDCLCTNIFCKYIHI